MAMIQDLYFKSACLRRESPVSVILPKLEASQNGNRIFYKRDGKFKVLTLLHGAQGNHTDWYRRTNVEWFAEQYNMAVVMPDAEMSFYSDMVCGDPFWTYISEELPSYLQAVLPLSEKREDNFVAGCSMGGYGAFKLALTHPERYAAAASLSGVLDLAYEIDSQQWMKELGYASAMKNDFGNPESVKGSSNDLLELMDRCREKKEDLPALYQNVGTSDFLYDCNSRFLQCARKFGINVTYEEFPGKHDWVYWRDHIGRVFAWISNASFA